MADTLLIRISNGDERRWQEELHKVAPDIETRIWPDVGDPGDIESILVFGLPGAEMRRFPNLRLIAASSVGVEALLGDPDLPDGVPIARVVDPLLTRTVAEYVLLSVLRYHRRFDLFESQHRDGTWQKHPWPEPEERTVAILGMGQLGRAAAARLAALSFRVLGWSRNPREVPGTTNFHGRDGLKEMLRQAGILVCLLPMTAETRGIVNAANIALMPAGGYIINAARGGHVVETDLLDALNSGHLAGATLDVFSPEPLTADHPFWSHPRILVTPHVAGRTSPVTVAPLIADNVRRLRAGRPLLNLVDPAAGY